MTIEGLVGEIFVGAFGTRHGTGVVAFIAQ